MSIVLERLIYETCSSDKLFLAFHSAKDRIEKLDNRDEAMRVFNALVCLADGTYKRNPIAKMFGV